MTETQETAIEDVVRPAPAPSPGGFFRDLVAALRGTEMDYTTGGIGRAVILLAIPMMLEMVMESVFAVVDIYFVGQMRDPANPGLAASAVATVGLTESLMTLVYAVAIGLSMGTTALVARRIGEKRPEQAAESAVQAILVGAAASIPVSLIGLFFARDLLALMGADAWAIEEGYRYMVIMLLGNAVIMLLFIINAIFRGAGDAAVAMRVLWLANGLNIILDPMLIFGWGPFPEMGLAGAAVATNIGRGTAVLLQFWILFHGAKHIRVTLAAWRVRFDIMWGVLRTSAGGILQFMIATASWVALVRIMSVFGSEALAGYTIAVRIFLFTLLPSWGLSNAAATLVGQNLGAKQPDRAERSVWITAWMNTAFLGTVSIVYICFAGPLVGFFTDDPAVLAHGEACLRIVSYGYVILAWGFVMPQAFNGAGDTWTPTGINLISFWLFQIPLAYYTALHLGGGPHGVYWSIIAGEILATGIAVFLFMRGEWKTTEV